MSVINNTLSEIGDVAVIKTLLVLSGFVTIEDFTDVTTGETGTRFFTKEYRFSIDNVDFSAWYDMEDPAPPTESREIEVDTGTLYLEYRYTRTGADATGLLSIESIEAATNVEKSFLKDILRLTEDFFPTGWAFKIPKNGTRYDINRALAKSENRALGSQEDILTGLIPDNEFFSEKDAELWETALGLTNGFGTTLEDRKLKIYRKMQFPGTVRARGSHVFIEAELRRAGFDVYVHENRFPDGGGAFETKTFQEVVGITGQAVYATSTQYGQIQYGTNNEKKIVNSMDAAYDSNFDVAGNYERTFFIGGATLPNLATIPAARTQEFRQLILTLKPVQTVAFMLVNYV